MIVFRLQRDRIGASDTTGQLFDQDGRFLCFILEDRVRLGPKVYAETAIPAGTYEIRVTRSPRFGRDLPLLLNVPGFEGIRIHAGNDKDDTEGCLLPGLARQELPDGTQRVTQSRDAMGRLMLLIQRILGRGEKLQIRIEDGP